MKLITLAEKEGKAFDWNEFLSRKNYTQTELNEAKAKSVDWVTCACGNQCDIIPRDDGNVPMDSRLELLGSRFYSDILHMATASSDEEVEVNRQKAVNTLKYIERRSQELIDEIIEQKKRECTNQ